MVNNSTPNPNRASNSGSDTQSIESLKKSAGYIVPIIVLALAGYFGWTYWQNIGAKPDTEAAEKYALIEQDNQSLKLAGDDQVRQKLYAEIDALVSEHDESIYAWQALMIKANSAITQQDYPTAINALEKAASINVNDSGLKSMAQLRYASVLLANGDLAKAKAEASKDVPMSFEATQQELLGDIYMAQQDSEAALRSYDNAWGMLVKRKESRPILRLKLENLGESPEPIESPPQVVSDEAVEAMIAKLDSEVGLAEDELSGKEANETPILPSDEQTVISQPDTQSGNETPSTEQTDGVQSETETRVPMHIVDSAQSDDKAVPSAK